jgi:hypothetical protein
LVLPAHKVVLDLKVIRVHKVVLDHKVVRVHKVVQVHKDIQDPKDPKDIQAVLQIQGQQEKPVLKGILDLRD